MHFKEFNQNPETKKRMRIMLTTVGLLFGIVFGIKIIEMLIGEWFISEEIKAHVLYVSAMKAEYSSWQPHYEAVGSLRAVLGVEVTTEQEGMIRSVNFKPGNVVKEGTVLAKLDTDPDIAQLHSLQASAELAKITYKRDKAQFVIGGVSKETVDTDEANLKSADAEVAKQLALISQKIVKAPFDGRLGICVVYPGQYLKPGDKVTSLETLDPVFADFYVPQAVLTKFKTGQSVSLTTDAFPNQVFTGTITTIDSAVDAKTRNIEIEATIANPRDELTPGMFSPVNISVSTPEQYLTLPQTAITFNSYGESVFVLKPTKDKDKEDKPIFVANQVFVTTGDVRGDQIAVLGGIKEGDLIVTSGQLKISNGSRVVVNNTIQPANNAVPTAAEQVDE